MVVLFLGFCAGYRLIFKRGDAESGGRYARVLHGDKSNRPILDDFSTHNPLDRPQEEYRDRGKDRDDSVESEQEVIRESDLQEIVLNPVLESYHPPAPAPAAAVAPGGGLSADPAPPDENLQGTEPSVSK